MTGVCICPVAIIDAMGDNGPLIDENCPVCNSERFALQRLWRVLVKP